MSEKRTTNVQLAMSYSMIIIDTSCSVKCFRDHKEGCRPKEKATSPLPILEISDDQEIKLMEVQKDKLSLQLLILGKDRNLLKLLQDPSMREKLRAIHSNIQSSKVFEDYENDPQIIELIKVLLSHQ